MEITPPPPELMFDGPQSTESFLANGQEFLSILRDRCKLPRNTKILDVGSGIGRKTIPLTSYLNKKAKYWGIDVTRVGVDWCTDNITTVYPNFQFQHVDVYSPGYNPTGKTLPIDFCFPFKDSSFDFVMACSLFTHMLYAGIANYIKEIHRVLRPKGKCLITYFLIADKDQDTPSFPYEWPHGRISIKEMPEHSMAFYAGSVTQLYGFAGLSIAEIYPGTWRDPKGLSYQDIIVASKN
jgi:SAM-dependent methyltransferase